MTQLDVNNSTVMAADAHGELPLETCLEKRFVLKSVLGRGGMGVVYKALDTIAEARRSRQPYVALKVLIPDLAIDERFKRLLFDEVEKARSLAHPNIISVREYFEDGASVFLTMEYLEGQTLDQLLAQNPRGIPQETTWPIIEAMGDALAFAHKNGIVHSDIKPANIFITNEGLNHQSRVKVVDFGIAKRASLATQGVDVTQKAATTILGGMVAYTATYASLDQLEGREPVFSDDVYALACTIYQMYTGEHPFAEVPAIHAVRGNMKPKRPRGLELRQWQALKKGLSFHAKDRGSSIEELIHGLKPSGKSRRPYVLGGIASVVVALGGSAFWFFAGDERPAPIVNPNIVCATPDCLEETVTPPSPMPSPSVVPSSPPESRATPEVTVTPAASPTPAVDEAPLWPPDGLFSSLSDDVIFQLGPYRSLSERGDLALGLEKSQYRVGEPFKLKFATAELRYIYSAVIDPYMHAQQIYPNDYQPDEPVVTRKVHNIPPTNVPMTFDEPIGRYRLKIAASRTRLENALESLTKPGQITRETKDLSFVELAVDVVE